MPKMRLGWYAGVSTALAGSVVLSAFHQRANFYSAMVYLAQSNFCLLVLLNYTLFIYSSFIYGLIRLCFGPLRAVEVEQLTERAWFAITETCLAMTIFRDEIGAWFLVMFTALVTGKVWGWIGDGRVEVLEQQPPANPRLFHLRLSSSLALSFLYDIWILHYTINTVIQQARPNMMVMFLFEFAVLSTCSWRTASRYCLSLTEQKIVKSQTKSRLEERRRQVREEREAILRRREQAAAAGEEAENQELSPLPNEEDVDEMDIEVPGWAAKGEWVLWLDLISDAIKLCIYVAFFGMLLTFYGLPIHIMRDLFMTSRDFIKRLSALLRYRRAVQEMNQYPDATAEELAREDTCIICREEMRVWDPADLINTVDRIRPKKLPCGHILHLGCLKSWLERQQVCPTCRRPVTIDTPREPRNRAAGLRIEIGGGRRRAAGQPDANGGDDRQDGRAPRQQRDGGPRIFNLGPIRLGFGANGQQVRELAQQFGMPQGALGQAAAPPAQQAAAPSRVPTPTPAQPHVPALGDSYRDAIAMMQHVEHIMQREIASMNATTAEIQLMYQLMAEYQRLRQRHQEQSPYARPVQPVILPSLLQQPPIVNPFVAQNQYPVPQMPTHTPFPSIPSRTASPLVSRYGALGSTPAIPSGSSDLPEGVTIPPGWSLLPLQRMEGAQQNSAQPSPQTGPQTMDGESATASHTQRVPTPLQQVASGSNVNAQLTRSTSSGLARGSTPEPRLPESSQFGRTAEPTPVVAPSPRAPNWGGSAQLFGNSAQLEQREPTPQPEGEGDDTEGPAPVPKSSSAALAEPSNVGETSNGGESSEQGKGKGKAVTVEEANGESDGE